MQKFIRCQIRAFSVASDFSRSAYGQKDMSLCEKPNQRKNHRIWPSKRLLQLPLKRKKGIQRGLAPFGGFKEGALSLITSKLCF
ncbi:MAG TPA: hypothetical protein DCE71_04515 [Parachlamydiales bacterium]|nr:hypothetical protein [Parachlamydiales bacterium]